MLVFKVLYETWLISRWKCVDLLTPFLSGQWCLCVLNNCYHVAVMCWINFICSMTIFRISFILGSPLPLNLPRGSDPGIQSNIQSDIFHIYCCFLSVCIQSFGNNFENWLSYCQIYVFDLWSCLKIQVGGVFIFTFYTVILIYRLFIHNSFGEMFRSLLLQLLHYKCQSNIEFISWSWRNLYDIGLSCADPGIFVGGGGGGGGGSRSIW